jgi:hypothetical protein
MTQNKTATLEELRAMRGNGAIKPTRDDAPEIDTPDGFWDGARILRLEAELHTMKTAGIIEVAVRNPSVSEYMAHWEGRAEKAEARIAELEELLGRYANCVADAEGVFFEPEDAEGEYIIELAKRAKAKEAPLPKPKPGQFSVPQSRP